MSYIQLVKSSFYQFEKLKAAKKIAFAKIIGHIFLVSFIFALPLSFQAFQLFQEIQNDGKQIAQQIPDFTIKNNQLTVEGATKGFIYQTDSIIFTFDPEGKRTPEALSKDLLGNFLSVGLLKDQAVLALPDTENVTTILGSNQLKVPYSNSKIQHLTGENLRERILQNQLPLWLLPLILLVALYPSFITVIFSLLIATLFANMFGRFRGLKQSFLENFKIMVMASTLPIILATIVSSLSPSFSADTFISIGSIFIFNWATRIPRPMPPKK